MPDDLDKNMLKILDDLRKNGTPSMAQRDNHEGLVPPESDDPTIKTGTHPPREGLSSTSIALLKLAPPVLVGALCHNLISRRGCNAPGKVLSYAFAAAASYMAFNRASQKLDPSPKNDDTQIGPKEPKHYCL